MLEYEKHKGEIKQTKRERKASRAHQTQKKLTPNQEEYRQHFVMQMRNRAGDARERLKRTGAAWQSRHESLRAAAQ